MKAIAVALVPVLTLAFLLGACGYSKEESPAIPLGMISTILNEDGVSGRNHFRASWSLDGMTSEEAERVRESCQMVKDRMERETEAPVKIWENQVSGTLILETTVEFRDPAEIEGQLATIYGGGYARPEVSIVVHGRQSSELKIMWTVDMTVNPSQVPCVGLFHWKVSMPSRIADVRVSPTSESVHQVSSGSDAVELTFGREDRSIEVSVTAVESKGGSVVLWPIIAGVAGSLLVALFSYLGRRVFVRKRSQKAVTGAKEGSPPDDGPPLPQRTQNPDGESS